MDRLLGLGLQPHTWFSLFRRCHVFHWSRPSGWSRPHSSTRFGHSSSASIAPLRIMQGTRESNDRGSQVNRASYEGRALAVLSSLLDMQLLRFGTKGRYHAQRAGLVCVGGTCRCIVHLSCLMSGSATITVRTAV